MGSRRHGRPTRRDVAVEAGLSLTTVSRVLDPAEAVFVAPAATCRVMAAVERVGYQRRASQTLEQPDGAWPLRPLSDREMQVLVGVVNGQQNAEIGRDLHIVEHTVKTHMRRILHALGARDRTHAVALALASGVVPAGAVQLPDAAPTLGRDRQLSALLFRRLGQPVCLHLVSGKVVACKVEAVRSGDVVEVLTGPLGTPGRYRLRDIHSIARTEPVNA